MYSVSQEDGREDFAVTSPYFFKGGYQTQESAQREADRLNSRLDEIEMAAVRTADPSQW